MAGGACASMRRVPFCDCMKSRRFRYLIAFVAAMFLANNVAVAARACAEVLKGQNPDMAQPFSAADARHVSSAAGDETPCVTQCAQGYKNPEQKLAPNVAEFVSLPIHLVPYFSVEIKPTAAVLALAPRAFGPPLTILFRNLRN